MALEHVLATIRTHSRIRGHGCATSRTLECLCGRLKILVKVYIFDHQITRDNWQREIDLRLRLTGRERYFLRFVPQRRLILQLDDSLHATVVVINVQRSNHFRAFQIADTQTDFVYHMRGYQLHYLRSGRKFRVNLKTHMGPRY